MSLDLVYANQTSPSSFRWEKKKKKNLMRLFLSMRFRVVHFEKNSKMNIGLIWSMFLCMPLDCIRLFKYAFGKHIRLEEMRFNFKLRMLLFHKSSIEVSMI